MSDAFLGEIRMFAGSFAPREWLFCDGRLLQISQNQLLFSLLGTTFGGDGQTNFALPDLRGRVPIHRDSAHPVGQKAGSETVTLAANNLPHTHQVAAFAGPGSQGGPAGATWGEHASDSLYATGGTPVAMNGAAVSVAGAGSVQAHDNMAPSTALSFIICVYNGIYPSRS